MEDKRRIGILFAVLVAVLVFIGAICFIACIEKIPVGYIGVQYDVNGGVRNETLSQGWHVVAPTIKVKTFTIGNAQLVLTRDEREGSESDESFKVATSDDASLAISFQMSYRFIPGKVVDTYKKFRGLDGEAIVDNRVRTVLKSKISEVTTDYSMMDIYSGDRAVINNKLTDYLDKDFSDKYGIEVIDASIIDTHPDEQLKTAINNRVQALQKKQQAKAEQETAKVEAETALIKAENEAEVKKKKAEGEKKANELLEKSLTDNIIKQEWIDKWDGKMPEYYGDGQVMIGIEK